jgi:FkbM family methyltransferase
MKRLLSAVLLALYRLAARSGVLERRWAQNLFLRAYAHYKTLLEARDAERLATWVPEAGVVIDVGANVGFFTLKFARWVGAGGRVLAVEPAPANVEHLRHALAVAALSGNTEVICAAASDHIGAAHLELNPFHPGDHKLASSGLIVSVTTLDAEVEARALTRVDLIKIDVQGAESMVLAGAQATLARWHPVLFVEIDDLNLRRYGSSARQLLDALLAQGYHAHRLEADGLSPALTSTTACAWVAQRGYADLLFLPHGGLL